MVPLHDPARWEAERRLVQPGRQPGSEVNDALFSGGKLGEYSCYGIRCVKEVAKCLDYGKAALADT